jgi:hypothetical protein
VLEYNGEHFLLIAHPYYAYNGSTSHYDEGYWFTPFVGFSVHVGTFLPEWSTQLNEKFEIALETANPERYLTDIAYNLGFINPKFEFAGRLTELKSSPRSKSNVNAYRIERYSCHIDTKLGIRNLTDPEQLKGHIFLPLDRLDRVLVPSGLVMPGMALDLFRGKPLATNLSQFVRDTAVRSQMKSRAISVNTTHFVRNERGFLVMGDIANFGATCSWAEMNSNMLDRGSEIAGRFRVRLVELFERLFEASGIMQAKTTGDGFLMGIPERAGETLSAQQPLARVLGEFRGLVAILAEMNSRVNRPEIQIGARLAIHWGEYRYGRVGGPISVRPDFDGGEVVLTARLESGLSTLQRESPSSSLREVDHKFITIVSDNALAVFGAARLARERYKNLGRVPVTSKEFSGFGTLFSLSVAELNAD